MEAAIYHALRAEGAAVFVVAHHEFLCHFVQYNQLDCIRGTVFDAQLAARAFRRIPNQSATQVFRRGFALKRVKFGHRTFEERSENISEHCTNSHAYSSLEQRADLAANDDGQQLQQTNQSADAPPHAHCLINAQTGKQRLQAGCHQ